MFFKLLIRKENTTTVRKGFQNETGGEEQEGAHTTRLRIRGTTYAVAAK
jgi:hypothetical protein